MYELVIMGQKGEFDVRDGLLYKGRLLCIPEDGDRLMWLREADRKSTRLNSSHSGESRMPSSA